jgi:hypothetical protein
MSSVIRLMLAPVLALYLPMAGCEAAFVGFVSNPGGRLSVSGTVSIVQLGFVKDVTGSQITVTTVTFLNPGTASTITFCGDQSKSFPMNQFVRADFNTGVLCSALVVVVVVAT